MRAILVSLILCWALPAQADVGRVKLACDAVSAAPNCLAATEIWDFEPTGAMVVLGDRLRLAGIETRDGADRLVILDLSLPGGEILAVIPLVGEVPLTSTTEFSPDGSVLLVAENMDWSKVIADTLLPQTLLVFDAWGKRVALAEGLVVTAMADAFGQNRLAFAPGRVTLDLSYSAEPALVSVDLATGAVQDNGQIPDGEWLFGYVFDRIRGWHLGDTVAETDFSRDGSPSAVTLRVGVGPKRVLAGGVPGVYDREFAQPVLSPDGSRLAVLQMADGAPGPILRALSLPEGREIWRGVISEAKERPALYRWTTDGALVVVQPHPVLSAETILILYRP
jgi:hypothetical protein